jgi:hypothetical protein
MTSETDRNSSSFSTGSPSPLAVDQILQEVIRDMPVTTSAETGTAPARIVGTVTADISRTERWEHFKCRAGAFRNN